MGLAGIKSKSFFPAMPVFPLFLGCRHSRVGCRRSRMGCRRSRVVTFTAIRLLSIFVLLYKKLVVKPRQTTRVYAHNEIIEPVTKQRIKRGTERNWLKANWSR